MSAIAKVLVALLFALLLITLGYFVATSRSSLDYQRLLHDVEDLEAGNEALRQSNIELRDYKDALENDSRLIERRVRGQLRVIRRDEILILLNQPNR